MDNEIVRSVDPDRVGPTSRLMEFFSPGAIAEAMEDAEWTSAEMIEQLAGIARDAANNSSRERMAAMKMLSDQGREALSLHGVIRNITTEAVAERDGVKTTLTAEGLKLLEAGSARTMSTLELLAASQNTSKIIDVEPLEESHERGDVESHGPDGASPDFSTNPESGGDSSDRSGARRRDSNHCIKSGEVASLHGSERPDQTSTASGPKDDDESSTRGAEDERISRTSIQPGGSQSSTQPGGSGGQHQQQHREAGRCHGTIHAETGRRTPYTPGEARRAATRAAETGPEQCGSQPSDGDTRPPDGASDNATPTTYPSSDG